MKTVKTCIAAGCLLLVAGSVLAQNYYMATQQAKRASAQNDAEQQRIQGAAGPGAAPAATPATTPAAPLDPKLQATLKNIAGLQSNFAVLTAAGDSPDPAQKISLLNNLSEAAQGTKATPDSVKKLADDLMPSVTGKKKLGAAQQTRLARDVHALFNSAHLTATQQQTLLTDVQNLLTDGGAPLDNAVDVVTDLKTIAAETK